MEVTTKSFTECTLVYLEKNFGLRKVFQHPTLSSWLEASLSMQIEVSELGALQIFQDLLRINVESWNEQDLSLHFIGPVFGIAHFTEPYRYNLFAQYSIKGEVSTVKGEPVLLFGKPDEMIASGYREPESPFFCFQEYKRETDPNGDPIGQLLAAMLVGQSLNPPKQPMYGCYVIGRDWYFVSLLEKEYSISRDYSAITDDVYDILKILKGLKEIVRGFTQGN